MSVTYAPTIDECVKIEIIAEPGTANCYISQTDLLALRYLNSFPDAKHPNSRIFRQFSRSFFAFYRLRIGEKPIHKERKIMVGWRNWLDKSFARTSLPLTFTLFYQYFQIIALHNFWYLALVLGRTRFVPRTCPFLEKILHNFFQ